MSRLTSAINAVERTDIASRISANSNWVTESKQIYKPPSAPFPQLSISAAIYRGADKSLARPGRKQATATEDFDVHISYL
jgi:hypothetical protein